METRGPRKLVLRVWVPHTGNAKEFEILIDIKEKKGMEIRVYNGVTL